jgi:hypothetical protein
MPWLLVDDEAGWERILVRLSIWTFIRRESVGFEAGALELKSELCVSLLRD